MVGHRRDAHKVGPQVSAGRISSRELEAEHAGPLAPVIAQLHDVERQNENLLLQLDEADLDIQERAYP